MVKISLKTAIICKFKLTVIILVITYFVHKPTEKPAANFIDKKPKAVVKVLLN